MWSTRVDSLMPSEGPSHQAGKKKTNLVPSCIAKPIVYTCRRLPYNNIRNIHALLSRGASSHAIPRRVGKCDAFGESIKCRRERATDVAKVVTSRRSLAILLIQITGTDNLNIGDLKLRELSHRNANPSGRYLGYHSSVKLH